MPIKHLETYLQERKHLQTLPLNVLTDSRLGIDAAYYLQSLYDSPPSREPLLAATGGLPLSLTTRIESDLRTLEKLRIKPVFVFPGLTPNKRWRHMQRDIEQQEACRERNLAWILRIFRNRNVEFLVAPYVAWAQLIYLQRHQKAYVHAIYGPTDTLLYPGVDKLITSVNLTATEPTFTFTSKKAILNDLGVSEDHFLDIGILVGFDYAQPFPPTVHEQALKATVDMVKFYKSGHAAVSVYADHPVVKSIQYPVFNPFLSHSLPPTRNTAAITTLITLLPPTFPQTCTKFSRTVSQMKSISTYHAG
ncbi:PIN domain-like protein [Lactarius pseudohatsudake]|nr:PIN domain-like protein [Lactarius pseudohatsudake]